MSAVDFSKLTAVAYADASPRAVDRMATSLRRCCPEVRLMVADDCRKPRPVEGADLVKLATDVGASAARNALLARVRTPYVLLLEGGIEFSPRTRLADMLAPVVEGRFDVVGGRYQFCRRKLLIFTKRTPQNACIAFESNPGELRLVEKTGPAVDGVVPCDATGNFFIGRTDKLRMMGGWDPQLMVDERIEFFVRAKRSGLRVGSCATAVADFWPEPLPNGSRRQRDFHGLAAAKMGVGRLVDVDGRVYEGVSTSKAAA